MDHGPASDLVGARSDVGRGDAVGVDDLAGAQRTRAHRAAARQGPQAHVAVVRRGTGERVLADRLDPLVSSPMTRRSRSSTSSMTVPASRSAVIVVPVCTTATAWDAMCARRTAVGVADAGALGQRQRLPWRHPTAGAASKPTSSRSGSRCATRGPITPRPAAKSNGSTRPSSGSSPRRPAPDTLDELQDQLDTFVQRYNHRRPHRSLRRRTPLRGLEHDTPRRPRTPRTRHPNPDRHPQGRQHPIRARPHVLDRARHPLQRSDRHRRDHRPPRPRLHPRQTRPRPHHRPHPHLPTHPRPPRPPTPTVRDVPRPL